MKLKLLPLLLALCASAHAANQQNAPQPEPVQPSRNDSEEPAPGEPQVTITTEREQTVEEFRAGGKLYAIKITPKHGHPYYLIDDRGDGRFARQEGLDSGVRVPQWVIKKF